MNLRNRVQLIGNVGKDPMIKNLENGKKIAKFSMATNEYYTQNGERKQDTTWHNLVAWDKTAEIIEKNVKTGSEIVINGKLVNRSYEDSNGDRKYVTEVVVGEIVFSKQQ